MNILPPEKLIAAISDYQLLEPTILGSGGAQNVSSFTGYFSAISRTALVVGATLAVLMIVIGGVEKIISKTPAGKSSGNEKITGAIVGLFLLLVSATILTTINPNLLNLDFFTPGSTTPPSTTTRPPGFDTSPTLDPTNTIPEGPTLPSGAREATAADPTGQGRATNFGYNDSEDNGRGSPTLDPTRGGQGIITNNPDVLGVALPVSVLQRTLGIPPRSNWQAWEPARYAGVEVTNSAGETRIVPIVDFGPGPGPRSNGVVIDETHALNQIMGGDGPRNYRIIPDYYRNNPRP